MAEVMKHAAANVGQDVIFNEGKIKADPSNFVWKMVPNTTSSWITLWVGAAWLSMTKVQWITLKRTNETSWRPRVL
jgi:hypothetical protein